MLSALLMFGHSAVYNIGVGTWSPKVYAVLRRMDHANIFVFIAGSYTPLATALLKGTSRVVLLGLIWSCALAGVVFNLIWLGAPRWLHTLLYVVMGWAALGWMPQFWRVGGPSVVGLLALGGIIYTVGAVIYARRKLNPWPGWFESHDIFHACTILAAVAHFAAIAIVVR